MRIFRLLIVIIVLVSPFLFGQGCQPPIPQSPLDKAKNTCSNFGMSGSNIDTLIIAIRADRRRGFSEDDDLMSAYGGCDNGCSGLSWCLSGCHDCSSQLVDAIYHEPPNTGE